jgi:hypothetical protein
MVFRGSAGRTVNELFVKVQGYAFSPFGVQTLSAFDQFFALTGTCHAHRRFLCRAPLINLYSSLTKEYGEPGIV